ncbi:Importin-beta protein [Opisthorchis viverrini]|uniref:Importin-beta protein n=1 Tax=Opisthorchis viverrini TaxID=6198 RepID=A0A1S8WW62_OPIVI|nr:Importin-beta protein [Opisthorchis viverrini]
MHKIIGFVPTLLNIVLENSLDVSIRQAASLYLKNNISEWWQDPDPDRPGESETFNIHEQDRQAIRNAIVAAVVASPFPLQSQLKVALSKIIKHDFPSRFPEFPDQVKHYLSTSDQNQWHGALVSFYSFVKVFEYKKSDGKHKVASIMKEFLPTLHAAIANLVTTKTEESLMLQLLILKIFFAFVNFHFPLDAMEREAVGPWNDVFCTIISDFSVQTSDPTHPFWKAKKWSVRILLRLFTRYGSPGVVSKKHQPFAEWYLKSFSTANLNAMLGICELYRRKSFVSKPVLSQILEYFSAALGHSFAWKILRNDFLLLVREVIFPLLSHSEEDAELWQDEPIEYIRYAASDWGRPSDPSSSAFSLLAEACLKRRGVLNNIMPFCMHILTSDSSPSEKDAVLHMYGAIAELLLKKEAYKTHLEPFLVNHVLPTLHAQEGYRRARACWLIGRLADAKFNDQNILVQVVDEIRKAVFMDPELPVRAFAALCLSELIRSQEQELLKLLRETEFDDLNQVIERIMLSFEKEIVPIAAELMQNLCLTFMQLVQTGENGFSEKADERGDAEDAFEYRSMVATSILDNMESMLQIAEEHEGLVAQLEPIVAQQIQTIFERDLSMFYEEALNLLSCLTTAKVSPLMWQIFDQLYGIFQKDSGDCFSEMMPCLHNFITVDRPAFISDPKRVETVATMCSQIIQSDEQDETIQLHAAKLLEVLLLDYRGQINQYAPKFIEFALTRLTRPITTSELRVMCMQVVVAGLLYAPSDVLPVMVEHQWPGTSVPVLVEFLKLWLQDTDVFLGLHDRRVCVLGLCLLLSLPADQRPQAVEALAKDYLPTLLVLFDGLKRAYATKAKNQAESDESDEEDEDLEDKALGSDEDEVDEEGASYMEMLEAAEEEDDSSDTGDDDDDEETILEAFETELDKPECDMDEYVTFYRIMTDLERTDPSWYGQLIGSLTSEQQTELKEVVSMALKCIQQKESKMIEQAGGYVFHPTIPSSFDFGANSNGQPQLATKDPYIITSDPRVLDALALPSNLTRQLDGAVHYLDKETNHPKVTVGAGK